MCSNINLFNSIASSSFRPSSSGIDTPGATEGSIKSRSKLIWIPLVRSPAILKSSLTTASRPLSLISSLADKYGIKFVTSNTCNSIVDGFRLLSDAVCQDVAEEVAYFSCYAERPVIKVYNGELLNDELFVTNFDSKGEIQGLATRFAQTISFTGLSPFDKEEQALKKMSIASFKDGFVGKVVGEYQKRNLDEALFSELYCMGRIEDVIMSRYMSKRYEDTREVSGQMLLDFKKNVKFCKVYNNMHTKNYN